MTFTLFVEIQTVTYLFLYYWKFKKYIDNHISVVYTKIR